MPDTHPADPIAQAFETHRDRLRAVAYRMLGSHADAEDAVQEAWLRLSRQDTATIHNLAGWLTTVVGRISLDVLRTRQTHPETPLHDQPELHTTPDTTPAPEDNAILADTLGIALITVLQSLRPDERLAFVLHDLFAVPFDDIATILDKTTHATKMLTSRARKKIHTTPPPTPPPHEQHTIVNAFLTAARHGNFDQLLHVLHPDVQLTVDTPHGTTITLGATTVATRAQLAANTTHAHPTWINNQPALITRHPDGTPATLLTFTIHHHHITHIHATTDPTKLTHLPTTP